MKEIVYVNGNYLELKNVRISPYDHGFLYGDGVFEGIRAYNGRVFKLKEHIDRLWESAKAIMLDIPLTKKEFIGAVLETCRRNEIRGDAYIRPMVTRGIGDFGLDPKVCNEGSTVIILIKSFTPLYETQAGKGLKLVTTKWRRNPPECLSPNIKSLNYLNNILAKLEANRVGADEALFLYEHSLVSEGSGENIFSVKEGIVKTPPTLWNLKGITRATVIELARKKGHEARVTPISLFDLYNSDEVFVTGTATEVVPVVEIDGRPIGDGKPGKITAELRNTYLKLVSLTGQPIWE
ncbi:MAG TPA: branched-chain-amino-acid transaminase [Thermoplasmata archaeon]|nr:branched-chain-amino-acid transaminase [Thermoplasmata archaeon]